MPVPKKITRDEAAALIQDQWAPDIIQAAIQQSAALATFSKRNMGTKTYKMPVLQTLPDAQWLSADDSVKPTTNMKWTDQDLIAEEIAAIAVIPENVLDDASYNLWGEVRSHIGEAIGKALDAAVFFGVGAPATFPAGGILGGAAANAHTETEGTGIDYGEDFNQAMALIEGDNFDPTITFAPLGLKPKLRGLRDKNGNPIYLPGLRGPDGVQADQLYGVPVQYVRNGSWDSSKASSIVADPRYLILGIRQDITVKMLDQASIGGVSLPETDSLAMRVKARFGFTIVTPVGSGQSAKPYPAAAILPKAP
jgi:HK97 family phage major capsid protein